MSNNFSLAFSNDGSASHYVLNNAALAASLGGLAVLAPGLPMDDVSGGAVDALYNIPAGSFGTGGLVTAFYFNLPGFFEFYNFQASGWNTVRNISVAASGTESLFFFADNFVHTDADFSGVTGDTYVRLLDGKSGNLLTGAGNDTVHVTSASDGSIGSNQHIVMTGSGDDLVFFERGDASLIGTSDVTRVDGSLTTVLADLGEGNDYFLTREDFFSADMVGGGAGNDVIFTGGGNDALDGGADDDYLNGGSGSDLVIGGDGNDTLIYDDNSLVYAIDSFDGGNDSDTVDFSAFGSAVRINLTASGHEVRTQDNADLIGGTWRDLATLANIENMVGTAYNDQLTGDAGINILVGGAGNDALSGGTGMDVYVFFAGDGHDTITETTGNDIDLIRFGAGILSSDVTLALSGGWFRDLSIGFAGTPGDTLTVINQNKVGAEQSVEKLVFEDGSEILLRKTETGTTGNDVMTGTIGNDTLYGDDGDDTINGGAGQDTLYGEGGDDVFLYDDSHVYTPIDSIDLFDGGMGSDTADFSGFGAAVRLNLTFASMEAKTQDDVDLVSGTWRNLADFISIENLTGSAFADELTGDANANVLTGGGGNDTLVGGSGADTYVYDFGDGHDTITETTGNDIDLIRFGAGILSSDVTLALSGGWFRDLSIGFTGTPGDTLTVINQNKVGAEQSVEKLVFEDGSEILLRKTETGTTGNDVMTGTIGNDTLYGDDGDDTINGGAGQDTLYGEGGDDTFLYDDAHIYTSTEVDTFDGGDGIDTADFSGFGAAVRLNLTAVYYEARTRDAPDLSGLPLRNIVDMTNIENLTGSAYADEITGDAGANVLKGGAGNDSLTGNGGADVLYGQNGIDTLFGGTGDDMFVFESASAFDGIDTINDFKITTEHDVIDIADVLSAAGYQHGIDALTDWVEITQSGSNSLLKIDVTGSGTFGAVTQIAILQYTTGLTDEDALAASGNLLVA